MGTIWGMRSHGGGWVPPVLCAHRVFVSGHHPWYVIAGTVGGHHQSYVFAGWVGTSDVMCL